MAELTIFIFFIVAAAVIACITHVERRAVHKVHCDCENKVGSLPAGSWALVAASPRCGPGDSCALCCPNQNKRTILRTGHGQGTAE